MAFLLIAATIAAMTLLYTADRLFKAFARARRYRAISDRLDAATERTDVQQEQRQTVAAASGALTSVMPAINRPPLTIPGMTRQPQRAAPGCDIKPGREADTGARDRRPARTGDKQAHAGKRPARAAEKQAPADEGTVHHRPRPAERSGPAGHGTGPRQPHHQ
jgi:hypothetical protein